MASIFSQIVEGSLTAYKVAEDESHMAFLDISPLSKGHTLVIPKQEIDYIFDLSIDQYTSLWNFASNIARAMKKVIECERIGIAVIGLEVPHAHIHLVPINDMSDINFDSRRLSFSKKEMEDIAKQIRSAI